MALWSALLLPGSTPDSAAAAVGARSPLRIEAKGFSVLPGEWGNPGVVIRNRSQTHDAFAVTLTVTWIGRGGKVIQEDGDEIAVIPAATTFYWGDTTAMPSGVPVRIDVGIDVRSVVRRSYGLPRVTDVRMNGRAPGTVEIVEKVSNTLRKRLDANANAYAVVFDRQGRVVGGTRSTLGVPLKPNRSIQVELALPAVSRARASFARGSAENEGGVWQPVR